MTDISVFLGIDPGREGAWALVDRDGRGLWVEDLPYADNELNVRSLAHAWGMQVGPDPAGVAVAIEYPLAFVNQSPTRNLVSGINYGVIKAGLLLQGYPVEEVKPSAWKARMGLNSDKEKSRARALKAYPEFERELRFKKDHGRAEALLIAEWCRRKRLGLRVARELDE